MARRSSQDSSRVLIPKGAAWLNLIEVWWRLFRRQALAGVDFVDSYEIDQATRVATGQLNRKAKPWGMGTRAQTAEASEAHFCVPSLRNGAVRKRTSKASSSFSMRRASISVGVLKSSSGNCCLFHESFRLFT